jgi:hypothetical protein
MKKIVLTFGLISGVVSSMMMIGTLPFIDSLGYDKGAIVGYTAIVLSFLLVYFGVRSYRENVGGGAISLGRGLAVGILITLISCGFYVATWEVINFKVMPDFSTKFANAMVEKAKADGATGEALVAREKEAADFKAMYDKPLVNIAMTFTEPFPIGVLVTLVSAVVLRRKKSGA